MSKKAKKEFHRNYNPDLLFSESDVKDYIRAQNKLFNEFLQEKGITLTGDQRNELDELMDASIADVIDIPEAELCAEQISTAFDSLHYEGKDYVIKENRDYIENEIRSDIEAEYDILLRLKGDMAKRDKLMDFIEAEIYPHYNDQVEYLKMF